MRFLRSGFSLVAGCLVFFGVGTASAFEIQEGIGFLAVLDAEEGAEFILDSAVPERAELERKNADRFGSIIFRELRQGTRYYIRPTADPSGEVEAKTLNFSDHPSGDFYSNQTLREGLNYIEMRDGTLVSAMVRAPAVCPGGATSCTLEDGPYPTLVEYSGYSVSDPDNPQPSTLIGTVLGYATVGVNMRGSGCSGGAFDLFDLPTTADGYDIVETVAAQSWVKDNEVGMVGISFPGISQLFVAGARPPSLIAVAPFATIADIYRAPGFPGGIFNNGFARTWLQDRADDAEPATEGRGQRWAVKRVEEGDEVCAANQNLRLQTQHPVDVTRDNPHYVPSLMDARSPINWVEDIRVPMFYSGAWQDEQVGGDSASLLRYLPQRKNVKITYVNGVHSSPMEPAILWRWIEFLDLYVGKKVPDTSRADPFAPIIYAEILGSEAPVPPVPTDRFDDVTDYDEAKRIFERDRHVRILMENGAGTDTPGLPAPGYELRFSYWPPRKIEPMTWYFGDNGTLVSGPPTRRRYDSYSPDSTARPMQTLPGDGETDSWSVMPEYEWEPYVDGTALGYVTEPLAEDVTLVGPGSVNIWVRSSEADTDLQVALSEVRPDGLEAYVQNGWLRASHRRRNRRLSNVLEPWPTHLEKHAKPMRAGRFEKIRVGLFASAHVFRAGSRIRISIAAPGGDRTRWSFDTLELGRDITNDVSRFPRKASRVVLPVIPRAKVPTALPPCPGLRGQPCRTYVPASNGG